MKIYAIIDDWEDGAYISEEDPDTFLYATLELAQQAKSELEAKEIEIHDIREAKRFERWSRMNAAKAILEANHFDGISDAISGADFPFQPYEYTSKHRIITLEVNE